MLQHKTYINLRYSINYLLTLFTILAYNLSILFTTKYIQYIETHEQCWYINKIKETIQQNTYTRADHVSLNLSNLLFLVAIAQRVESFSFRRKRKFLKSRMLPHTLVANIWYLAIIRE